MCWKQKSAHQNESYQVLSLFLDFIDNPTKQDYEEQYKQLQYKLFYWMLIINAAVFASQILKSPFQSTDMALLYALIIAILILFIVLLCLKKLKRYIPFFVAMIQVANYSLILEEDLADNNFSDDISRVVSTVFLHSLLSVLLSLCFNKWIIRSLFLITSWEYMCKVIDSIELSFLQFQVIVFSAVLILYLCERQIKQNFGEIFYERANLKEHSRILDDLMPSSLLILQKGPLGFQCTFKNQKSKNEFFKKETKGSLIVNKMLKDMLVCREISSKTIPQKIQMNSSPNNQNMQGQITNYMSSGQVMNSGGGNSSSNLFFKTVEENYRWMKETQIQNLYDLLSIKHKYRSVVDEKEGTFFTYQDQYYDVKIVWKNSRQILVLLNNISEKINAEKLQELDEYKDKLLASVCHDIKTPVCQLIQFLNFALEKGVNKIPQDSRNFIEISLKTTGLLMYLISDILDYSQIKKKIFRLRIDKFNLKDVLEEVIDLFKFQAEQKGLQISSSFKQGSFPDVNNILVYNDANRIKQVLINLVSNALKFTQQGQIIIIIGAALGEGNNLISISVQDTGIGMTEEIKAKLFEQYSTFNQEGLNKNGIGLGLNNCKTIVGELGPTNQFQVESVQNEGSIFTFQVYQNNMKYAEQIKEEEEEQDEEINAQQQNKQIKNNSYDKDIIEEDYQLSGEDSQAVTKQNKNQSVSLQALDELKCRAFSQNNELVPSFKDKRSTVQEYSNQSGNIIYEECSPAFLPNQYDSPMKKPCGEVKGKSENRRHRYQSRQSMHNSSGKSNLHDSQDMNSFDLMSIQEYHYSHPPNQVYPSINFQTSQLLQSTKQLDSRQSDLSPQIGKSIHEKRVSFISSYLKKTIMNQVQATSEEASSSDQSSNLTINSIQKQSSSLKSPHKKILQQQQQQNTFNFNGSPKERRTVSGDDFSQIRNMRYSLANAKLQQYQGYKANSQYLRMSRELDSKQFTNRQKSSKSEATSKSPICPAFNLLKSPKEILQLKPKHNILIVDDNYFNILALKLLISENENIIVYQAENGQQAIQKARQMNFKIVFMDMQMPIMDGETAAKIMKTELKIINPIISLTANEYTEDEKKELTMFDDFLNKPIQKQKVQQILERYKLI